jgi:hypothetical protein
VRPNVAYCLCFQHEKLGTPRICFPVVWFEQEKTGVEWRPVFEAKEEISDEVPWAIQLAFRHRFRKKTRGKEME